MDHAEIIISYDDYINSDYYPFGTCTLTEALLRGYWVSFVSGLYQLTPEQSHDEPYYVGLPEAQDGL